MKGKTSAMKLYRRPAAPAPSGAMYDHFFSMLEKDKKGTSK